MKVLVIYDVIPEEQRRAIVDMTEEEYELFSKVHNYVVNVDMYNDMKGDIVDAISFATTTNFKEDWLTTELAKEYAGKWVNDLNNTDLTGVDKLICCGFLL